MPVVHLFLFCFFSCYSDEIFKQRFFKNVFSADLLGSRFRVSDGQYAKNWKLNGFLKVLYFNLTFFLSVFFSFLFFRSLVIIHVEDIDEFAPRFSKDTYEVEVEEGHLFDAIIQLTATDRDRSANYKDISGYFILDNDVPFEINKHGKFFFVFFSLLFYFSWQLFNLFLRL